MSFYDQIYDAVLRSAQKYGARNPEVLARLGAAQSVNETGHGKHLSGGNNYFGIKGGDGPAVSTREVVNGRNIQIKDHFRSYPSMQHSADDYVKFLHENRNYRNVINAQTVPEAINAQAHSGYASDPKYKSILTSIHNSNAGRQQAAGPMPAPVASPSSQGSTGRAQAAPSEMRMQYVQSEPRGSALNQINPKDPSGPLLNQPAPVTAPSATPQQLAQPQLVNNLSGLGMKDFEGVVQAPRQASIMNNFPMNVSAQRDMMGETPYAMNMSGMPMTAINNDPVPVQAMPTTLAEQPNFGVGASPTTGGSDVTPSYEAPSTTPDAGFTPTTPGTDGGGGDVGGSGDMLAGLADALGNLGGGGEGGGGGGPQLANPPMDALTASSSMPDFPQLGPQYGQQLAQRGALANQPVPFPSQLAQGFNLKPIGQAGMQPQAEDGQAPLATKRLFT